MVLQPAAPRNFDNAISVNQPMSPPVAPTAHRGGPSSHQDGPRVPSTSHPRKPGAMMWSPSGSGTGSQASYGPGGQVGDTSSHQHVPAPRPVPSSSPMMQFSMTDLDYAGGPPWQARDDAGGTGGTWNQRQRGPPSAAAAASSQHHQRQQPQQQQQQQRGRSSPRRDPYANHGHPAKTSVSESRLIVVDKFLQT